MHLKRIITSLVALPLLIAIICLGGPFLFSLLVIAAGIIALNEYYGIWFNGSDRNYFIEAAGYLSVPCLIYSAYFARMDLTSIVILANIFISALLAVVFAKKKNISSNTISGHILGICYIPLSLAFLMAIRNFDKGEAWIFLVLFIVFASDTGAYYAGTYYGKHKLCPEISPGKTWEGFFGGLAFVVFIGTVFRFLFFNDLPLLNFISLSLFTGLIAPVGDLFESMLKRAAGVKDSGKILPGHGGLLDRIDAMLFAFPAVYAFKTYVL
ncbi:phosphatidate cytidylyltransferase [Desulforegula conservatrix]|uniref:phosphatidate cytidylyltransferase n=1 Tax=Desulforegula conservatrix TaxID=153026 RepID=UPI00040F51A9|nr:phosphatidate cytidylyltransferase [Desulforegula conservatrix]